MTTTLPVDVLHAALKRCASSRSLFRRVEDGRVHEDMLLAAMHELACQALPDSNARLVLLESSTHPLDLRDAAGGKPEGYGYLTHLFLELDEQVLRLHLRHPAPGAPRVQARLVAQRFPDRTAALRAHAIGPHHHWATADLAEYGSDAQGLQEFAQHNDLDRLRVDLAQARLQQATAHAPSRAASGPRL